MGGGGGVGGGGKEAHFYTRGKREKDSLRGETYVQRERERDRKRSRHRENKTDLQ